MALQRRRIDADLAGLDPLHQWLRDTRDDAERGKQQRRNPDEKSLEAHVVWRTLARNTCHPQT